MAGKRCLIVGGTSGIGKTAAERFREEGACVVTAGIDGGERTMSIRCDATRTDDVARLFADAIAILGGLDVLFHTAGGSGRRHGDGPLHECSDDGWRATLDLNLTSTFLTNRAAVCYYLSMNQPGVILNTATMLALDPSPSRFDTVAYAAAKGGVLSLSRLAAARYAPQGIRVNVIAPGLIDTPMAARAVTDPAIRLFLEAKQPLARGPLDARSCAEAAVYLCSDESRHVTGVVLPIDGGWGVSEGPHP